MAILHMIIIECVVPYLFLLYMIKSLARVIKFNVHLIKSDFHQLLTDDPLFLGAHAFRKTVRGLHPTSTTETATVSEEAHENQLAV